MNQLDKDLRCIMGFFTQQAGRGAREPFSRLAQASDSSIWVDSGHWFDASGFACLCPACFRLACAFAADAAEFKQRFASTFVACIATTA